jgi:signal transduction histidine kinase
VTPSATRPVLVVEVCDDGKGIDVTAPASGTGLGLASMRVRAEELGCRLRVEAGRGGVGTRVVAELPSMTGAP